MVLVLNCLCYAQGQTDPTPEQIKAAAKVRSDVLNLRGRAWVLMRVRLHDGTEYKSYIKEVTLDSFVINGGDINVATRFTYYQVRSVKPYISRGKRVGAVVGYVLLFGIIAAGAIGYARK